MSLDESLNALISLLFVMVGPPLRASLSVEDLPPAVENIIQRIFYAVNIKFTRKTELFTRYA